MSKSIAVEAVGAALEHVTEIAEPFEVEIDSTVDMLELMEKANRTVIRLASNVLECTSGQNTPSQDGLPESSSPPDRGKATLEAAANEIRNRLTFVGRFARRLAKGIDPTSREGAYVRVIMSETQRLEQALHGMG